MRGPATRRAEGNAGGRAGSAIAMRPGSIRAQTDAQLAAEGPLEAGIGQRIGVDRGGAPGRVDAAVDQRFGMKEVAAGS